jgi:Protein of unknown function (DUF2950)
MRAHTITLALALAVALTLPLSAQTKQPMAFPTPESAARALEHAARADGMDDLLAIFGPGGEKVLASSDPVTAQRNRETFAVAFAEEWRLQDLAAGRKELVVGHESWPFPVPLVKTTRGWVFDLVAGKEEILARRIGRNELAAIDICRTYVRVQHAYASSGHDGKPAGLYAQKFASDAGTQNGLYWPAKTGQPRSPLGDLIAQAADDGQARNTTTTSAARTPFHGYYFRILSAQGAAASGGAKNYLEGGDMRGGFALVAWPAEYNASGVMTFVVNQDGVVFEKDLGPETGTKASALMRFDPDLTWRTAFHPATRTGTPSPR